MYYPPAFAKAINSSPFPGVEYRLADELADANANAHSLTPLALWPGLLREPWSDEVGLVVLGSRLDQDSGRSVAELREYRSGMRRLRLPAPLLTGVGRPSRGRWGWSVSLGPVQVDVDGESVSVGLNLSIGFFGAGVSRRFDRQARRGPNAFLDLRGGRAPIYIGWGVESPVDEQVVECLNSIESFVPL